MVDILHRIGVQTPTPATVYDALATVEGLAGWWTDDTKGSSVVGEGAPAPRDTRLGDGH